MTSASEIQKMQEFVALMRDDPGAPFAQLVAMAESAQSSSTFHIQLDSLISTIRAMKQAIAYDLPIPVQPEPAQQPGAPE